MSPNAGSGVDFLPLRDMIDLSGKMILVTGGNPHYLDLNLSSLMMHLGTGGLGKAVIIGLLMKHPSKIYVTARNPPKFQHLIEEISLEHPTVNANSILHLLTCDLTDLKTVQAAAHEVILSPNPKLDIIIGAAGVMFTTPSVTKDGYEIQFGTNHMSHALLIKLLLPLLLQSPDPRIVLFTSGAFGLHPSGGILFESLHTTQEKEIRLATRWQLYGQSKLANLLYAAELARKHPSVTSVSVHPGAVYTGGFASLGWKDRWILTAMSWRSFITPEEGSWNALWCISAHLWKNQKKMFDEKAGENEDERVKGKGFVVNGAFYEPVGVPGKHMRMSADDELARKLWEWTEKELEDFN
jgi:NAD(P)-dependent dehydrogenase (short-subunit alcohol dehydrogenase family)